MGGRLWRKLICYLVESAWKGERRLDQLRSELINLPNFSVQALLNEICGADGSTDGFLRVTDLTGFLRRNGYDDSHSGSREIQRLFDRWDRARRGVLSKRQLLGTFTPVCEELIPKRANSARLNPLRRRNASDYAAISSLSLGERLKESVLSVVLQELFVESRLCYLCQMLAQLDGFTLERSFNEISQTTSSRQATKTSASRMIADLRAELVPLESSITLHSLNDFIARTSLESARMRRRVNRGQRRFEGSTSMSRDTGNSSTDESTDILDPLTIEKRRKHRFYSLSKEKSKEETKRRQLSRRQFGWFCARMGRIRQFSSGSTQSKGNLDDVSDNELEFGNTDRMRLTFDEWVNGLTPFKRLAMDLSDSSDPESEKEQSDPMQTAIKKEEGGLVYAVPIPSMMDGKSQTGKRGSVVIEDSPVHNDDDDDVKPADKDGDEYETTDLDTTDWRLDSSPEVGPSPKKETNVIIKDTPMVITLEDMGFFPASKPSQKEDKITLSEQCLTHASIPSETKNVRNDYYYTSPMKSTTKESPMKKKVQSFPSKADMIPELADDEDDNNDQRLSSYAPLFSVSQVTPTFKVHSSIQDVKKNSEPITIMRMTQDTSAEMVDMEPVIITPNQDGVNLDFFGMSVLSSPFSKTTHHQSKLLLSNGDEKHSHSCLHESDGKNDSTIPVYPVPCFTDDRVTIEMEHKMVEPIQQSDDIDHIGHKNNLNDDSQASDKSLTPHPTSLTQESPVRTSHLSNSASNAVDQHHKGVDSFDLITNDDDYDGDSPLSKQVSSPSKQISSMDNDVGRSSSNSGSESTTMNTTAVSITSPTVNTSMTNGISKVGLKRMLAKVLFAQISLEKHHERGIRSAISNGFWNLHRAFESLCSSSLLSSNENTHHHGLSLPNVCDFLCSKHGLSVEPSDVRLLFRRLSPSNEIGEQFEIDFQSFKGSLLPISESFNRHLYKNMSMNEDDSRGGAGGAGLAAGSTMIDELSEIKKDDREWDEGSFAKSLSEMIAVEKTADQLRRSLYRRGWDVVSGFSWIDTLMEGRVRLHDLKNFLFEHGYHELNDKHCLYLFRRYNSHGFAKFVSNRIHNRHLLDDHKEGGKQSDVLFNHKSQSDIDCCLTISYSQFASELLWVD